MHQSEVLLLPKNLLYFSFYFIAIFIIHYFAVPTTYTELSQENQPCGESDSVDQITGMSNQADKTNINKTQFVYTMAKLLALGNKNKTRVPQSVLQQLRTLNICKVKF